MIDIKLALAIGESREGLGSLVGEKSMEGHRWGAKPVTEVTRADVVRMVEEVGDASGKASARQALAYCRKLFNWAIARDLYGLTDSPCDRVSVGDLVGRVPAREHVLNDDEIRKLWQATAGPDPEHAYVRLLLILGCRRELAWITRDELDLDGVSGTSRHSAPRTASSAWCHCRRWRSRSCAACPGTADRTCSPPLTARARC